MIFYDEYFAREYEKRLKSEGYPGNLLGAVLEELEGISSVIDVGAGTGFFAVPLAAKGFHVEAVEPSGAMIGILRNKIDAESGGFISLRNERWEDWDGARADALICVHALYPMKGPMEALRKMKRSAGKSVVIVRSGTGPVSLSSELRRRLGIHRGSSLNDRTVRSLLGRIGVQFRAKTIEQERVTSFGDLEGEARYYRDHLGLPVNRLEEIMELLTEISRPAAVGYSFTALYRDVIFVF
jgi:SAM-dependent methyltransferase